MMDKRAAAQAAAFGGQVGKSLPGAVAVPPPAPRPVSLKGGGPTCSERPQIRITGPAAAAGRTEWQSRIREHHRANFDDSLCPSPCHSKKPAQLTAIEPGRDPCHRTLGSLCIRNDHL